MLEYVRRRELLFSLIQSLCVMTMAIVVYELALARKRATPNLIYDFDANKRNWIAVASPADKNTYPDTLNRPVPHFVQETVVKFINRCHLAVFGLSDLRSDCTTPGNLDNPEADVFTFQCD